MGKPTESWTNIQLKEEARRLLDEWGRNYNSEEKQRMYDALMLIMRQEKRALPEAALNEFLTTSNRPNDIAAFVQKYGLFKRPDRVEKPLKVSIEDFRKEQRRLRSLLGVWTPLREGDTEGASETAEDTGFQFSTDPRFAFSVQISTRLARRTILTLIPVQDRLEPVLYCRDVLTGLYALLFQAVVAGRPWAICPNCSIAFSIKRKGQRFHGERCQQAYKQRRYRKNLNRKKKAVHRRS